MTTRAEVVAEARSWIGTKFQHQARMKGVATDCGGFIGGVCINVGIVDELFWEREFRRYAGYGRVPKNGVLESICHEFMTPIAIADAQAADVVLMRFTGDPQHLAFLAPYVHGGLSVVHAWSRRRPVAGVVEHGFDAAWQSRVTEAFALPGVI